MICRRGLERLHRIALLLLGVLPCWAESAPGGAGGPAADPSAQEALVREVRRDLGAGYSIEPLEDLFVVATNADRDMLERCKDTVGRAYRALTRTYFERRPDRPLSIYLFRDKTSYEDYCVRHYREKPSTPFGFYWPSERKLVMNISTGTGTLVHEMVHPLLAADFPGAPVWLNEGLASLYEQCRIDETSGTLRGLVNWRLPNLQGAIAGNRLIALKDLTALSADAFYEDTKLPYAEARYLCLYLQEQGQLVTFYKSFRANASAEDPEKRDRTGGATLQAVTGRTLASLQKEWVRWVGTLEWER